MSIWVSVKPLESHIKALENDCDAANYEGEGEPHIVADVATCGMHELTRLLLIDERGEGVDVAVLLTAEAARELGTRLMAARPLS